MLPYYGEQQDVALEGKTAVITGGAAGIGYATAEYFHGKGVNCVLADLNGSANDIAKALDARHMGISGNVLDAEYRERVVKEAAARYGHVDFLINSAGIVALESAEEISEGDWDRTIAINLTASFKMAQAVGRHMIEANVPGVIINMASQAGVIALDKHVAYCASKGGIIAMTKVLAYEWGKYGIRVNCVSPTVVLTELGHKAWDGPVGDAFKKEIPAERFAEPNEIAAAIAFLCSPGAGMITGHNLLIDGGFTIK